MTLAAFDVFGRVAAHGATVGIGFDALAVEHGGGGAATLAVRWPLERPQPIVERPPGVIAAPLAENVTDGFPRWEVGGQQPPGDAAFEDIKDGVDNGAPVGGRSSALAGLGEHGFDEGPLGVGEAGVVGSDFHRSNSAARKLGTRLPAAQGKSFLPVFFAAPQVFAKAQVVLHPRPIFQTGS